MSMLHCLNSLALMLACWFSIAATSRAQTTAQEDAQPLDHLRLPRCAPEQVAMRGERLERIEELVAEALKDGKMPGCVITVGRRGHVVYHRAFGNRQLQPDSLPMTKDTVFDLASLTKPIATATCTMMLIEQGKLRLNDRVSTYLPEFGSNGKESATILHLLTHQAGLTPDNALSDYQLGREQAFENIFRLKARYEPGTRFMYSDVGFILLDKLIETASGAKVDQFAKEHLFEPLGMRETGYLPEAELRTRAATTEQRDGRWLQGEVHDPRAAALKGVAGHAGLFSTADDLSIYAQMLLEGGSIHGQRILSEPTVRLMTTPQEIAEPGKRTLRGLGWDMRSGYSSNRADNMSPRAFGHGGFTGTVLWIDPEYELFFVFLSNRVHPTGKGSINHLAGRIATVVVSSIDDTLRPN